MDFQQFDAEYLRRLTVGDPVTEQHFTNYFGELLSIKLRGRVRSLEEMQDIRQETFVRVLTALRQKGGVEHPERLGAFVNSFCRNILFERYRVNSRSQPLDSIYEPANSAADAESELVSEQRLAEVRRVMRELPERDRSLLTQVFLKERSKDEICVEFGVDRNYLRVLVHRSVERARKLIKSGKVYA